VFVIVVFVPKISYDYYSFELKAYEVKDPPNPCFEDLPLN
jgi:hypothetical protein